MDDNGHDSDGESDTDSTVIGETAKDVPDSDPDLLQDHTSSSEFDEEPDDTSLQVKKTSNTEKVSYQSEACKTPSCVAT